MMSLMIDDDQHNDYDPDSDNNNDDVDNVDFQFDDNDDANFDNNDNDYDVVDDVHLFPRPQPGETFFNLSISQPDHVNNDYDLIRMMITIGQPDRDYDQDYNDNNCDKDGDIEL